MNVCPWIHTASVLLLLGLLGASKAAGRHVVGRSFLCFNSESKLLLVVERIAYCYNMLLNSNFKVSFVSWAMTQFIHSYFAVFNRFSSSPQRHSTFHPHAHTVRNVAIGLLQTEWKMENFLFQTHISQRRYFPGIYFSCNTLYSLWCYSTMYYSFVLRHCMCL